LVGGGATEVSGQRIGPTFKGQEVQDSFLECYVDYLILEDGVGKLFLFLTVGNTPTDAAQHHRTAKTSHSTYSTLSLGGEAAKVPAVLRLRKDDLRRTTGSEHCTF
jgi:hypothetical protein